MSKMRPLIILISVLVSAVYGKPGILESPAPTPSAAPAILANLATPTPSVASLQADVAIGGPVINIGGQSHGVKLSNPQLSLPAYGAGFNFGLSQPGLGLTQPGLGFSQGLGLPQPGISYGPPGLSLPQSGLSYIQPGLNFAQSGFNFAQPSLNFLPFVAGLGSPQLNLAPVGPTISPFIGSTIGPSLEPALAPNVGPTIASTIGPTIASTIGPAIASPIGPTIASVGSTLGPSIASVGPTAPTPLNAGPDFSGGASIGSVSGSSVVHKHVYVYVAPEVPEEIVPRKPIEFPPPQTHYRIIFIKAPAPPKPTVPVIPPVPQDEEKTIVYVLAKRPEQAPEIKIQTPPPTQPAKPEVYFIRYQARKEGDDSVHEHRPVDIDVRGGPPPVTVNNIGLGGIAQDLNTASLNGGSALSNAIQSAPSANLIQISTTPIPKYGPPSYEKK